MTEKYCLRWNDFQANVRSSFRNLRNANDFYDVTLVSDDYQQVSAHKVVLSASSEYFKNILTKNKHSHPLLCLNGVKSNDLHNILDYIYNGEIQIFQDDLDSFLAAAKRFQLEGLKKEQEDNDEIAQVKKEHIEDDFMPLVSNSENDSKSEEKERTIPVQSFDFENIAELHKDQARKNIYSGNPIPKTPVALNLMNEKELETKVKQRFAKISQSQRRRLLQSVIVKFL